MDEFKAGFVVYAGKNKYAHRITLEEQLDFIEQANPQQCNATIDYLMDSLSNCYGSQKEYIYRVLRHIIRRHEEHIEARMSGLLPIILHDSHSLAKPVRDHARMCLETISKCTGDDSKLKQETSSSSTQTMDHTIQIRHIDLRGKSGAEVMQHIAGCDPQTAKEFVNHETGPRSDPFSSQYVPPPPRLHIRLERAEMAAEKGDMETALPEFEYLYTTHHQLCDTHARMYIGLEWTHYRAFCEKKKCEAKKHTMQALSTC